MPTSAAPTRTPDTDEVVRALLIPRKGEWESIAKQAGVSYSWVSKFMNDGIPNPGNTTLKKLRTWLEANPRGGQQQVPAHAADNTGGGDSSLSGAALEPPAD